MDKKAEAAMILRELCLRTDAKVLRELAGHYPAHYLESGMCRNNQGVVADDHHPLRGWVDYPCPHCGREVRTVFAPSSGGGITRFFGLDLPREGKVRVKISRNATMAGGVQGDVVDLGGKWLVDFHPGVYTLRSLYRAPLYYILEKECGHEFEALVTGAAMRTLRVFPIPLLPPRGWEAAHKIKVCGRSPDIKDINFPGGKAYVVPLKGDNFLLLF